MGLLYNLYRLKYRYAKHLNLKVPVDVSLELSSHCNMSCGYCYHSDKDVPFTKGFMSFQMARDIIDQSSAIGVHAIKLNYRGEATMNPNFGGICGYAKSRARGMTFIDRVVNSNFKIRSKDQTSVFDGFNHLTKVKVSFDSFSRKVFEEQRTGGHFDMTYGNLLDYHDTFDHRKTKLVIQAVRTDLNKDEPLADLIRFHFPKASYSIRDVVAGRTKGKVKEVKKRNFKERQSCIQAHARLIFGHDGNAQHCCPDIAGKLSKHNIKHSFIEDIFNSDHALQLRRYLKSGAAFYYKPCDKCPSHESFAGYKAPWTS